MKHHPSGITKLTGVLLAKGFIYVAKMCCHFVCDYSFLTACFVYLIRRNTSVDESYEWDSADACVDSEVLEATRFDQSHTGSRRGRGEHRYDQTGGLQDQQEKGNYFFHNLSVSFC